MTVDVDVRFTWWHFFISSYFLSVSNEISFTALKSAEFTQSSGSFNWGGPSAFGVYIFSLCAGMSLFDCFKWALIDCIVKCRGHSELWQFQWGGPSAFGVYMFSLCAGISLFDCFKWALIDCTEKHRGHSELWGPSAFGICILIYTGISLYFLISWLFQMGSHWWYENVWLSLSRQAVSNGGGNHLPLVSVSLYILVFPYIF